ncbi:MAG: hypothetical protein DDT42_01930 [candidate division WS2 bacterium]|uniref:Uncharacterized protein n=1 Tax=Psychracetigena formicireducens TaxID=2986056 RepID=A0A9E2F5C2_PSYF1|nr:hypothetical protein [Candidatus Psychracetigena formicireducens]
MLGRCSRGYTLMEALISLGLIFMIVFAISALALGFSRYQTIRLERSLVQENFRNTVSIIAAEVRGKSVRDILEPMNAMSFELYMRGRNNTIIRYHAVRNVGSIESQVFRKVYNVPEMHRPINQTNWAANKDKIIGTPASPITPREVEPVSDKIRAISHILFTHKHGVAIFITGEMYNKTRVSYVSLVFPRN